MEIVVRMTYSIRSRQAHIPVTMYTLFGGQIGHNRITVHMELTVSVLYMRDHNMVHMYVYIWTCIHSVHTYYRFMIVPVDNTHSMYVHTFMHI